MYIITPFLHLIGSESCMGGSTTLKSSWKVCSNGSFRGVRNPLAWRERVNSDLDFAATMSGRWHHGCNYSSDPPMRLRTRWGICVYVVYVNVCFWGEMVCEHEHLKLMRKAGSRLFSFLKLCSRCNSLWNKPVVFYRCHCELTETPLHKNGMLEMGCL